MLRLMNEDHLIPAGRREQAHRVEVRLEEHYPDARSALNFSTAFELLVATVLSAQTTDVRVNQVTPRLFSSYPDAVALAGADREELEATVHSLGMGQRRTDQLIRLGHHLVHEHEGRVPGTREALTRLPGVGRKTANVVLGNWFDLEEITVDTHLGRVARRLGWTEQTNPGLVENDLRALLPEAPWTKLSHQLILLGREFCKARKPQCGACFLSDICPKILGKSA